MDFLFVSRIVSRIEQVQYITKKKSGVFVETSGVLTLDQKWFPFWERLNLSGAESVFIFLCSLACWSYLLEN